MLILGNRDITEQEKPHINTIQQCIKTPKPAVLLNLEAKRKRWSGWEEKATTCSKKKQFKWGFKLRIIIRGSSTWKGSKSPIFTLSFKPSIIWIQKHLQITLTMQGLRTERSLNANLSTFATPPEHPYLFGSAIPHIPSHISTAITLVQRSPLSHTSEPSPELWGPDSLWLFPQELPPWKSTVINHQ